MKRIAIACALTLVAAVPAFAQAPAPFQFQDLFNGKDLAGWVNVNTAPDTWSVRDGIIVVQKNAVIPDGTSI